MSTYLYLALGMFTMSTLAAVISFMVPVVPAFGVIGFGFGVNLCGWIVFITGYLKQSKTLAKRQP